MRSCFESVQDEHERSEAFRAAVKTHMEDVMHKMDGTPNTKRLFLNVRL